MTQDLIRLANINSGSNNLPGLMQVAHEVEGWVDFSDCEFSRHALPPRRVVTDNGEEKSLETGPVLRWDYRPHSARRVLLMIHYDTVFDETHSFQTCERIEEDHLRGPGVADAKGGIVVLRYALKAAQQYNLLGDLGFTVVLNPDEEVGSLSSCKYLQGIAPEFQVGLLFEPCLPTGELVSQRKGSGNFDIVVRGKSAHAGRHFGEGRNAVARLSEIFYRLDQLNEQQSGLTVNVGFVRGGGPVNVVPDLAVGRLNIRVADSEVQTWVEDQLRQIVGEVQAKDGYQVAIYGGITSPPKAFDAKAQAVARLVEEATADVQKHRGQAEEPVKWKSTGGVCDGNKLAAAGLPNIDTLGPRGDGLHSDQEWVQPSSLPEKAQTIAALLARLGQQNFPAED